MNDHDPFFAFLAGMFFITNIGGWIFAHRFFVAVTVLRQQRDSLAQQTGVQLAVIAAQHAQIAKLTAQIDEDEDGEGWKAGEN